MLGAIAGDMIGSVYEGRKSWQKDRRPDFEPLFHPRARFTDDTVLTVAVAESILAGGDLGGDADTLACIAGGVAHAFYGPLPGPIRAATLERLDDRLRGVVEAFERRFPASA